MDICAFLESISTGIIANIIYTAILIYIVQKCRYYFKLRRYFHNKAFDTYWKRFPDEIKQTVSTKVKNNIITFEGVKNGNTDTFSGEIIINPLNLKYGEGYHTHSNSDGYAFIKVIIKDSNTLYVEAPYTGVKEVNLKKTGFRVYQAFIWKKKN